MVANNRTFQLRGLIFGDALSLRLAIPAKLLGSMHFRVDASGRTLTFLEILPLFVVSDAGRVNPSNPLGYPNVTP